MQEGSVDITETEWKELTSITETQTKKNSPTKHVHSLQSIISAPNPGLQFLMVALDSNERPSPN
jgi:hypothetical protein